MMSSAEQIILRHADRSADFGVADPATENFLINSGYAEYTRKPPMRLTKRGREYADRNRKWLKTGRTA